MIGKNIINRKGFTLMELLIVIAILGILGVAFVPNILKAPAKARDAVRVKNVNDLRNGIEAYYAEKGKLPPSNASNCVDDTVATALGMKKPVDPNALDSCATDGEYLYAMFDAADQRTQVVADARKYVVGAILEVPASANTSMGQNDPKAVPPPVGAAAAGTYFVATGPM